VGIYGGENTDCDTPYSLINATLEWIEENVKDDIDFVIWTGDSARHDSDEKIPRDADQVLSSNRWVAQRFQDTFRRDGDNSHIPIVPTFGNNDILPHNILTGGPNKWLKAYGDIWRNIIPEEQRHGFERGGWFYVEVIPNKLAVFSLNTLYFFEQNAGVDGCESRSEPGFEHMEWLRIQLQFIRERGMKAILMGHVPPARTESKKVWDETCWQRYTLWLQQYRDVVVGGIFGHMNIDHFMLQDTKEVQLYTGQSVASNKVRTAMEDELTIQSMNSYLKELRNEWSDLPDLTNDTEEETTFKGKKGKKSKKDKALRKIGGPWGERYQVTHVSPSVVPNFLPTLRIIHYNITGLDDATTFLPGDNPEMRGALLDKETEQWVDILGGDDGSSEPIGEDDEEEAMSKKRKKGGKKLKKPKHPDLTIPSPPSIQSPPGPAYSPQTLTLLGYTQYFANLTFINNEFKKSELVTGDASSQDLKDKIPKPNPVTFQVEYDTFTDPVYKLKDMTVRSYIKLAHRIGQYKTVKEDQIDWDSLEESEKTEDVADEKDAEAEGKKDKKPNKQLEKNKIWLEFIRRAYVGALSDEELQSFEVASDLLSSDAQQEEILVDTHSGEL
jgi:endopolyphosphatase